ncbi:MAG: PDZ domain-containing protein [Rhodothermaceae bacterium]|nr:PDZ domain-containing protein [Rhodothermaceae bacterium]
MSTGTKRRLSVAALLMVAFLAGIFFITTAGNLIRPEALSGRDAQAASPAVVAATDLSDAFEEVAEVVNPAVVQIRSTRLISQNQSQRQNPFQGSPFEDFFQQPGPGGNGQPFEQNGLGSGAFIRPDGYLVTNNHVIEGADELEVSLFDGRVLRAEVIGADPFSDLAVLKVGGDDFPYLAFDDAGTVRVGQWVLAFGSPLSADLGNTVTAGIISATGRRQGPGIANYIQTDAAINPGNSGGPLVNLEGEIVGINSAIATRTGGFQGISFAIPIETVAGTVEQLIDSGTVERGYLGIGFTGVTPSLARALDVPLSAAQISQINEDAEGRQPAGEAGLEEGDVIVAVDGQQLADNREIISRISNRRPGDTVELTYNRNGDERTATVTLGRRPGDPQIAEAERPIRPNDDTPEQLMNMDDLGLTLQDITPAAAQRLRLDKDGAEGVLITEVERDSEAYRDANLRAGDVITEVDREAVASLRDFEQSYDSVRDGDTFVIRVQRGDGSFLTALTKPS